MFAFGREHKLPSFGLTLGYPLISFDSVNIARYLYSHYRKALAKSQKRRILSEQCPADLPRSTWSRSLQDPTAFYLDCFRFFHQHLPDELRLHRAYFGTNMRGFGEDAFHVMWFLLFREFKPANF